MRSASRFLIRLLSASAVCVSAIADATPACPAGSAEGGRAVLTDFASPGDTDASNAFSCALAALCKDAKGPNCGGELWVPKGTFTLRHPVDVTHPVRIVGVGPVSKIVWDGGPSGAMFELHPSGPVRQDFERLALTGATDGHDACATGVATAEGTIGIRVASATLGIRNVSICGLGVAVKAKGAVSGDVQSAYVAGNRIGIQLDGAESWLFDAVTLDRNFAGMLVRRSAQIGFYGFSVTANVSDGIWIQGCAGCTLDGIHFADNGTDLHIGAIPEMNDTQQVAREVSVTSADGARHVAIVNPRGCPVDHVSFQNFAGTLKPLAPAVLDIDSACAIHVSLREAEVSLQKKNSFDGSGPPEVVVFETTGFAPPGKQSKTDIGVSGGVPLGSAPDGTNMTLQSVTADTAPRAEQAKRSFRVLSDGRASLGGPATGATLTVTQPAANGSALDLVARDSQPGIRWRDTEGRTVAEIDGVSDSPDKKKGAGFALSNLQGKSMSELVRIDPSGRVGVGTKTPGAALDVADTLRIQGTLLAHSLTVPAGKASDRCEAAGTMEVVAGVSPKDDDTLRVCDGVSWRAVKVDSTSGGKAP